MFLSPALFAAIPVVFVIIPFGAGECVVLKQHSGLMLPFFTCFRIRLWYCWCNNWLPTAWIAANISVGADRICSSARTPSCRLTSKLSLYASCGRTPGSWITAKTCSRWARNWRNRTPRASVASHKAGWAVSRVDR